MESFDWFLIGFRLECNSRIYVIIRCKINAYSQENLGWRKKPKVFSGFITITSYKFAIEGKTPLVIANVVKTVKIARNSFMMCS